jgi:hypothetical protein
MNLVAVLMTKDASRYRRGVAEPARTQTPRRPWRPCPGATTMTLSIEDLAKGRLAKGFVVMILRARRLHAMPLFSQPAKLLESESSLYGESH